MAEKEIEGKETKKKTSQDSFDLGEVATQTEIVIRNTVTGEVYSLQAAIALLLNKVDRLERGFG